MSIKFKFSWDRVEEFKGALRKGKEALSHICLVYDAGIIIPAIYDFEKGNFLDVDGSKLPFRPSYFCALRVNSDGKVELEARPVRNPKESAELFAKANDSTVRELPDNSAIVPTEKKNVWFVLK
jgi:hypothetical protein